MGKKKIVTVPPLVTGPAPELYLNRAAGGSVQIADSVAPRAPDAALSIFNPPGLRRKQKPRCASCEDLYDTPPRRRAAHATACA